MSKSGQSGIGDGTGEEAPKRPETALDVLFFPQEDIWPSAQPISFPDWLRPAVLHAAKRIHARLATEKEPAKARDLLVCLTCDGRMRDVWDRLYETRPKTDRGDVELRTFIASLEISWRMLFRMSGMMPPEPIPPEPILKLFAELANVALKRENVTSSQIREILRSWA